MQFHCMCTIIYVAHNYDLFNIGTTFIIRHRQHHSSLPTTYIFIYYNRHHVERPIMFIWNCRETLLWGGIYRLLFFMLPHCDSTLTLSKVESQSGSASPVSRALMMNPLHSCWEIQKMGQNLKTNSIPQIYFWNFMGHVFIYQLLLSNMKKCYYCSTENNFQCALLLHKILWNLSCSCIHLLIFII